jgi:hypothetical protein
MTGSVWLGAFLSFAASIYLGLGVSLVGFQFPGALATTRPENFPERFGDPVRRAVAFFAVVSLLMIAASGWLLHREWDEGDRRLLILAYLVFTVAATAFTVIWIVPVNRKLFKEISDPAVFTATLHRWVVLNVIRSGIWVLEWIAITWWFVLVATREV